MPSSIKAEYLDTPWTAKRSKKANPDKIYHWLVLSKTGVRLWNDGSPSVCTKKVAYRIVECVNACEGLKRPLETIPQMLVLIRDLYDVAMNSADDLRDLSASIIDLAEQIPWPTDHCWGCSTALKGLTPDDGRCENCGRVLKPQN